MYFYPLFSGSSGNCYVVSHEGTIILLDAGLPGKKITEALALCRIDPREIDAIVVTHEHRDHVSGVGVLSRRYDIPVYTNVNTWEAMTPIIGDIAPKNTRIIDTGRDFFIGSVNVYPFAIPHDCAEPVAYSFHAGKRKLTCATDIGHVTQAVEAQLQGSDLLLIESNHDTDMLNACSYPASLKRRILGNHGHLSNENCGKLLVRLANQGLSRAILGHLSRESNTEERAYSSAADTLLKSGIGKADFELSVAHRDRVLGKFEV